jgi:hypothetical protein
MESQPQTSFGLYNFKTLLSITFPKVSCRSKYMGVFPWDGKDPLSTLPQLGNLYSHLNFNFVFLFLYLSEKKWEKKGARVFLSSFSFSCNWINQIYFLSLSDTAMAFSSDIVILLKLKFDCNYAIRYS